MITGWLSSWHRVLRFTILPFGSWVNWLQVSGKNLMTGVETSRRKREREEKIKGVSEMGREREGREREERLKGEIERRDREG